MRKTGRQKSFARWPIWKKASFYSYYKQFFSSTPHSDLIEVRLDKAKNLLTNQDQTIEAIAKQCGFTDTKYFYRIFKKEEHITPSEYRNAFHHKKLVL